MVTYPGKAGGVLPDRVLAEGKEHEEHERRERDDVPCCVVVMDDDRGHECRGVCVDAGEVPVDVRPICPRAKTERREPECDRCRDDGDDDLSEGHSHETQVTRRCQSAVRVL